MKTQPTPETDSAIYPMNGVNIIWPELARKLESERDEAREELAGIVDRMRVGLRGHPDSGLWGEAGLIAATMRCVDALGEVTEQRDEARETIATMEIRHAAVMRHTQSIVDDANQCRDQRDEWRNEHDRVVREYQHRFTALATAALEASNYPESESLTPNQP